MPPKKGKDKKKKKKEKKGVIVEAGKLLKALLKTYEQRCEELEVGLCVPLKKSIRTMIEEDKLLHKFLIDPKDRRPVEFWDDEKLTEIYLPPDVEPKPLSAKEKKALEKKEKKLKEMEAKPLVRLLPLIDALRAKRYVYVHQLNVWEIHLDHEDILALAGMVRKGIYQFQKLELLDCFISPYSITKFAPNLGFCRTLTELCLDYNQIGDEGCKGLADGLAKNNKYLLSLSLCYCELTQESGIYLNQIICFTPIRSLFLNGNHLQAEGVILIIGPLSEHAENEHREKIEEEERKKRELEEEEARKVASRTMYTKPNQGDATPEPPPEENNGKSKPGSGKKGKKKGKKGKKGKKKGKKNKGPPPLPEIGPQIEKLHLADNGIDHLGKSGNIAPMRCMQLIRVLISYSKDVQEIDLFGNDIGDLGSRQLLEGLMTRKGHGLPTMGLTVGHRVNQDTFDAIMKLAPGLKKKGKRGKKGKK